MCSEPRSLGLLVSRQYGAGRAIIAGVMDQLGEGRDWFVDLQEPWPWSRLTQLIARRPAGIICSHQGAAGLQQLADSGIPAVVIGNSGQSGLPAVGSDLRAVAELAVEHFQSLRVPGMAWIACQEGHGSEHLLEHVIAAADERHMPLMLCPEGDAIPSHTSNVDADSPTAQWLQQLPQGTGIFCSNDMVGFQVLRACRLNGFSIPGHFAILAADNDEFLCSIAEPSLSSIDANAIGLGRQAVVMLLDAIAGAPVSKTIVHLPPNELVRRQSSDVAMSTDPLVRWALHWIRTHLGEKLTIKRMVYESGSSRRTLELRFREHLGHSPLVEIRRQQLEVACRLLQKDGLSAEEAARNVGLETAQRLNRLLRKELGTSARELSAQRSF